MLLVALGTLPMWSVRRDCGNIGRKVFSNCYLFKCEVLADIEKEINFIASYRSLQYDLF